MLTHLPRSNRPFRNGRPGPESADDQFDPYAELKNPNNASEWISLESFSTIGTLNFTGLRAILVDTEAVTTTENTTLDRTRGGWIVRDPLGATMTSFAELGETSFAELGGWQLVESVVHITPDVALGALDVPTTWRSRNELFDLLEHP